MKTRRKGHQHAKKPRQYLDADEGFRRLNSGNDNLHNRDILGKTYDRFGENPHRVKRRDHSFNFSSEVEGECYDDWADDWEEDWPKDLADYYSRH